MRISTNTSTGFPPAGAARTPPLADKAVSDIDPTPIRASPASGNTPKAANVQANEAPSMEELSRAIEALQQKLQSAAPNLQFMIDQDTGQTVIKVIDSSSNEVIRQIPPEELLRLAKTLRRMEEVLLSDSA